MSESGSKTGLIDNNEDASSEATTLTLESAYDSMSKQIFTIGHSNHTWETFSPLLIDNAIELLVDVRSRPVSRFAPFSNRRRFPELLDYIGIDYEFMGGPLGGKPEDPAMYDPESRPDYGKMRVSDEFQQAISRLAEMASRRRTVLLCSEGDPKQCHRRLLLGPPLQAAGHKLMHIMRNGGVCVELEISNDG